MADINKIYEMVGEEAFNPSELTPTEMVEEAYLKAEYNSILIEMMMEE